MYCYVAEETSTPREASKPGDERHRACRKPGKHERLRAARQRNTTNGNSRVKFCTSDPVRALLQRPHPTCRSAAVRSLEHTLLLYDNRLTACSALRAHLRTRSSSRRAASGWTAVHNKTREGAQAAAFLTCASIEARGTGLSRERSRTRPKRDLCIEIDIASRRRGLQKQGCPLGAVILVVQHLRWFQRCLTNPSEETPTKRADVLASSDLWHSVGLRASSAADRRSGACSGGSTRITDKVPRSPCDAPITWKKNGRFQGRAATNSAICGTE